MVDLNSTFCINLKTKKECMKKILTAIAFIAPAYSCNSATNLSCENFNRDDCYSRTIFVPRQLSYNPILENGLVFNELSVNNTKCIFSVKPIYTQSIGKKFKSYFNIGHENTMYVNEDGSGDIDSLWFKVVGPDGSFYSSELSFCPVRKTYGAMLFAELALPCNFALSINTALVKTTNEMNLRERNIESLGTLDGFATIQESLSNPQRKFGKVCGKQSKTGFDDIQLKILKNICGNECYSWDIYALIGIPTGAGTQSRFMFEPLVGSKHAQLGAGTYYFKKLREYECGQINFLGEFKYRYGFSGKETRLFDLTENAEWSRYMLLVKETDKYATFFASNNLALLSNTSPRNSIDLYLAINASRNKWNFELGYDFWYRSVEKVGLAKCTTLEPNTGIADLLGIARLSPESASTANISESVLAGPNQMTSDSSFVSITDADLNLNSAAAPKSISNSFYASISYNHEWNCHPVNIGLSVAYEKGKCVNVPDNVFVWANFDFLI